MKIYPNFIYKMMEERIIVNNDHKKFNFQINVYFLAFCFLFIAITCTMIFNKWSTFEQLKILQMFQKYNKKFKYQISQWESVGVLRSEHYCKS